MYEADECGGLAVETKDPAGLRRVTRHEYDASGNKLSTCFPDGFYIQFRYDSRNHLTRVYRAQRPAKRFDYDERGNKIREVGHNGEETIQEWDHFARRVRTVTGADAETKIKTAPAFRYNSVSSTIYNPDVNGETRDMTLDALQRIVRTKFGSGKIVRYTYGKNSGSYLFQGCRMDSTVAHPIHSGPTHYKYDACCRKIEMRVQHYAPSFFQYDAAGNLILEVDSKGLHTRHEYDALNRRIVTTLPNARIRRTLYSSTGLEYETTDEQGNVTIKEYDGAGEVVERDSK